MPSKRDNQSATTFWMDADLKKTAAERARQVDWTLTDMINHAVRFYLEEGYVSDKEFGQKMANVTLAAELKETGKYGEKIAEIESKHKGIEARVSEFEDKLNDILIGDELQQKIQAVVSSKVDPVLERLGILVERLSSG